MSYLLDLNTDEIVEFLKQGSTNQRRFIEKIINSNNIPHEVIENIINFDKETCSKTDLRGWLNGGVMTFEEITKEIEDNNAYILCRNGFGVVYY